MKDPIFILTLITFFFTTSIMSCQREIRTSNQVLLPAYNPATGKEISSQEDDISRLSYDEIDSIEDVIMSIVLKQVLDSIKHYPANTDYTKNFSVATSYENIIVEVLSANYFTNSTKHLLIRRIAPSNIYIDVFYTKNGNILKAASHKQRGLTYVGDTIFDVNGDGLKDFVVNWYGSAGCCLKGFSDVYLARRSYNSFSQEFEFINPTFSPKEHLVRGICYGHPGDTEMYKYRWNKEKLDTIEYVMFEKDTTGNNIGVIISKQRNSEPDNIIRKQKHVPVEYKSINDFSWFMDN